MVSSINLNTNKHMEVATDTLKAQIVSIITTMGVLGMEFQLTNQQLQAIAQTLATIISSLPAPSHSIAHPSMHKGGAQLQLQAPPCFLNQPPSINHLHGYNNYNQ